MKLITFILILCISVTIRAGSLSGRQIEQLRNRVKSLPDEVVSPSEVTVIETNYGTIIFEFFPYVAPIHAMNFKKLTKAGYFDSTTFHRVIPGFMIQGGDILSRDDNMYNDGTGGPGYTLQAEFGKKHIRGAIAAARMADQINPEKRSNGSQFYICVREQPFLDKAGYTVFGQVIKGMNVVDKIVKVRRNKRDRPINDVVMKRVYVTYRSKINLK
ncbi:MAG: peptidylprolyl isomerase [Candidatus Marinimicrobia bacterium]|nr:peptidylprolyl isomerase [Candidatus Neomarinimicrobiota bacterium]